MLMEYIYNVLPTNTNVDDIHKSVRRQKTYIVSNTHDFIEHMYDLLNIVMLTMPSLYVTFVLHIASTDTQLQACQHIETFSIAYVLTRHRSPLDTRILF